jgi:AcrR family transcriptional regulator
MFMGPSNEALRPPGRPQQSIQVRGSLIHHARLLFITHPYDKVSLRMIATNAGVNMGMIRYYFNNKAGLFEAMLRDTLSPMQEMMEEASARPDANLLISVMTFFYKTMSKQKHFPRLISRTMQLSKESLERQIVEKLMQEHLSIMQVKVYGALNTKGILQEGVSTQLGYYSWLNLMIFPFVASQEILELHGINIDDDFLSDLLEHNIRFLNQGIIN